MSVRASILRFFIRSAMRLTAPTHGFELKRRLAERVPSFPRPPASTTVTRFPLGKASARWIVPENADGEKVILYFHGGGWVYGWVFPYDGFVSGLAQAAGARALGISYRLAPAHPFPAALEDCLNAYRFLLDRGVQPEKIVLMGDSAGANLVLVLLLKLKSLGLPLPKAGVCLSPPTDLSTPGASYHTNRRTDALLSVPFAYLALHAYVAGHDRRDPLVSPVFGDLSGLPPLLIQAGGGELLLSDAVRFAAKAREAGAAVRLRVYPRMWHVFQLTPDLFPEARRAVKEIEGFLREQLG